MEHKRPTEVEGVDIKVIHGFHFSGIKVIGGIQVGLGVVCIILGVVNIMTYVILGERPTFIDIESTEKQKLAIHLAISSTPIWSGIWFCLCGGMALNISKRNKASVYCLKTSFMVLSILCASIFGPACLGVSVYEAFLRHQLYVDDYRWMIPLLTAFFSFNEVVFGVASAIVCCCCASVKESKVKLFLASDQQERLDIPQRQITPTRPINPHLQENNSSQRTDLFLTSNSHKEHASMFKTKSGFSSTKRFTADHLKYNNVGLFLVDNHTVF